MKIGILPAVSLIGVLFVLCSCATPGSATGPGFIVTNHYEGILVSNLSPGKKRGKACTENIAGLVTSGDASMSAAMKDGGITQVSSVDHHYKSVLGVYGKMCTIVTGN